MTTRADLLAQSEEIAGRGLALLIGPDGFGDRHVGAAEAAAYVGQGLEALRLAVMALAADPENELEQPEPEDPGQWTRVELFGHAVCVGIVRDIERYGRRWLEVTVPPVWASPESVATDPPLYEGNVKVYHPNAVYALTELDADEGQQQTRALRNVRWPDDPYAY